jgi:DNA-binding GntR family transcriptional regulator
METILLGHIVRFAGDRKHPDDLAAEAVDILQKILTGGPLADASRKAIDDLLAVLEPLVILVARRAATATDQAGKNELAAVANRAIADRREGGEHSAYLALRQGFYDLLFRLADNNELPRVTPLGRADLFRAQIRPFQPIEEQRRHADGYRLIAEAIAAGDAGTAEKMVAAHFAETRAMLDRLPPIAFANEN